jgi:multiple sugar transport system permease protein
MALQAEVKRRKTISFIVLLFVSLLWIMPLVWGLATSFKEPLDIALNPTSLIPEVWSLEHYL